ncbi:MAG: TlpA disulfide reductase family protein [Thermoanaerobaculia bacterium]|nr:TlpA disulfide reductase family protein [Thermoanaerobaculia bacterium]
MSHRRALAPALAALFALAICPAGAAADGLVLPGLGEDRLDEAELRSGATVVVVWASWSPRCRDIGRRVNELAAGWKGRARVITVNFQEEKAAAREFRDSQQLASPVFLDADAAFAKKHGVTSLPFLLVFRDGDSLFAGKLPPDAGATLSRVLGSG